MPFSVRAFKFWWVDCTQHNSSYAIQRFQRDNQTEAALVNLCSCQANNWGFLVIELVKTHWLVITIDKVTSLPWATDLPTGRMCSGLQRLLMPNTMSLGCPWFGECFSKIWLTATQGSKTQILTLTILRWRVEAGGCASEKLNWMAQRFDLVLPDRENAPF